VLRPNSGKPIDRRDCYRMVLRIAKAAGIPRHISPHSLRTYELGHLELVPPERHHAHRDAGG
jgi:site-specific recombinase XerD